MENYPLSLFIDKTADSSKKLVEVLRRNYITTLGSLTEQKDMYGNWSELKHGLLRINKNEKNIDKIFEDAWDGFITRLSLFYSNFAIEYQFSNELVIPEQSGDKEHQSKLFFKIFTQKDYPWSEDLDKLIVSKLTTMFLGKRGTGKSTLAYQAAINYLIDLYFIYESKNGEIIQEKVILQDGENGFCLSRFSTIMDCMINDRQNGSYANYNNNKTIALMKKFIFSNFQIKNIENCFSQDDTIQSIKNSIKTEELICNLQLIENLSEIIEKSVIMAREKKPYCCKLGIVLNRFAIKNNASVILMDNVVWDTTTPGLQDVFQSSIGTRVLLTRQKKNFMLCILKYSDNWLDICNRYITYKVTSFYINNRQTTKAYQSKHMINNSYYGIYCSRLYPLYNSSLPYHCFFRRPSLI